MGSTPAWTRRNTSASAPPPRYGYVGGVTTVDGDTVWVISHGNLVLTHSFSTLPHTLPCPSLLPPGRGDSEYLDSTWYFNFATEEWSELNVTGDTPRARSEAAGGVYPGSGLLWLSMGQGSGGRKLSDTWVLNITSGQPSTCSVVEHYVLGRGGIAYTH